MGFIVVWWLGYLVFSSALWMNFAGCASLHVSVKKEALTFFKKFVIRLLRQSNELLRQFSLPLDERKVRV